MHKFLLFLAVFAVSGAAMAQSGAAPAIEAAPQVDPEQNDFTLGTGVTPRGHFQVENSSFSTRRGPIRQYRLGETLLRVPVAANVEVRATIPAYIVDRNIGLNGLDDANLEARFRFGQSAKRAFALTIGSMLPTGKRQVAERRYQPQAVLSASLQVSERANITANLGVGRPTNSQQRFTQGLAALELTYTAAPKVDVFGEVYGFNRLEAGGKTQKFVAGGLVFNLNRKTALYGRGGAGINNDVGGSDRFLQLGFARLF